MDVRLSAEQQALRDSAAPGRRPARPARRRRSSTTASGPPSSTPPSPRRAGASCGRAEDDGAPLASGVEAAIVAEELGRGLADAPFLGPTLAAELRRLAGAPPAAAAETVALAAGSRALAVAVDGALAAGRGGHRRRTGADAALVLVAGADGYALGSVAAARRRPSAST